MSNPAHFRYRAPRLTDLDALQTIEQQSFTSDLISRRRMRHWILAENRAFLVCECQEGERKGEVAGYILIFYRKNSSYARLYSIVVSKDFRGHGIARKLMDKGEGLAKKNGRSTMRLEVSPSNRAAIQLYQSLSYQRFGIYQTFYEDGGDALRFEKHL